MFLVGRGGNVLCTIVQRLIIIMYSTLNPPLVTATKCNMAQSLYIIAARRLKYKNRDILYFIILLYRVIQKSSSDFENYNIYIFKIDGDAGVIKKVNKK